ncbi:MAG: 16S rRNA (adenine(1518)-N(6)/adenine(1519)-N(6))-dimethyltransferase RsmA [Hyphomicrobium sp.]
MSGDDVAGRDAGPSPDGLPPLREVIRTHGLEAKKSLGQNFILDLNLTRRIARAAGPLEGRTVVEVGPGPGGLTRALLIEGAARVVAIERDRRCLEALGDIAARYPGRLTVHEGDALEADWPALLGAGTREAIIAANLPYAIATKLLIGWLETDPWPPWFSRMVLMFQREVAERIVAAPGSKAYGRLAVISQWRTAPRMLMTLSPKAFTPPPKVESAVVEFVPIPAPEPACRVAALGRVTAAAFGQRRKMLRSSLKQLTPMPELLLAEAGIAPELRAEQLTVADFARLAAIHDRASAKPPDQT